MDVISFGKLFIIFVGWWCISSIKADMFHEEQKCIGKLNTEQMDPNINIQTHSYSPMVFTNFDQFPDTIVLGNNGNTITINFTYSIEALIPTISEGPLEGKGSHRLQYLYFNWMENIPKTYVMNDVYMSAELHLVFYSTKYSDYEKALAQNNALAIMSFVFEQPTIRNDTEFEGLAVVANSLKDLIYAFYNKSLSESQLFTLNDLLPNKSLEFQYTYNGKMMKRTCSQDVIWLDFKEKLPISVEEVLEYKKLRTSYVVVMLEAPLHYRPPTGIVYKNVATSLAINARNFILIIVCFLLNILNSNSAI